MSSRNLRIIFILSVISAILMLATQLYWVRTSYDVEHKIFDSKVKEGLHNVTGSLLRSNDNFAPAADNVKKEGDLYFTVQIGDSINAVALEKLLVREFSSQSISSDFEYGIYSCTDKKIKHSRYVYLNKKRRGDTKDVIRGFPNAQNENNYFAVQFPNRNIFLSGEMNKWLLSTALLFAVLIILGYALFIIFKQKRLSEIQKNFVNNMTHEFKTPLATIKISAEVLKNPNIVNNPQRLLNYATIVANETDHLTKQVERVLHMAKSKKGNIELNKESVKIKSLVDEITELTYVPLIRSRGGEISINYADEDLIVHADTLHLKNVIGNLLDNAIKYCEDTPKIRMNIKESNGVMRIDIHDNGIGVSEENLKNIFKRFYRVPTGNVHDVKGFGLGLNYVRLICERHGGKITAQSTLGKGSTFSIFIPTNKK